MRGERLRRAAVPIRMLHGIHVDDDPVIAREAHVVVLAQTDRLEQTLAPFGPARDRGAAARTRFGCDYHAEARIGPASVDLYDEPGRGGPCGPDPGGAHRLPAASRRWPPARPLRMGRRSS